MASFFALLLRRILVVSAIGLGSLPALAQQSVIPHVITGLNSNGGQKTQAVGNGTDGFSVPMPVAILSGGGTGGTASTFGLTFPGTGTAAGAEYLLSPPTYTSGQMVPLQTDVSGNLKVNIATGAGSGGTSSTFGSAFPTTGTAIGLTNGTNMVAWSATSNYGTAPSAIPVPAVNASVTASALPTGAATSANQTSQITQETTTATQTTTIATNSASQATAANQTAVQATSGGTAPSKTEAVGCTFLTSAPTLTNGQMATCQADVNGNVKVTVVNPSQSTTGGAAMVSPGTVTTGNLVKGAITTPMTVTTSTQLIAATASKVTYVTSISCKNTSATATLVNIQDGSGGTTLLQIAAGATYGGDNLNAFLPLTWTTSGNGLFAADATTGASVTCAASGYAQ